MSENIKVITLNARGLNNNNKRLSLFQWVKDQNIDVAFIQESYCVDSFKRKFCKQWKGKIFHSLSESKHARGVCTLVNDKLQLKVISNQSDKEGRKVLINVLINDQVYTMVNIYCPTNLTSRIKFLISCREWIKKYRIEDSNLIIGGDVNCIDNIIDRTSNSIDKSSAELKNLKDYFKVNDVWRKMHPDEVQFTYIDPSYRNFNSRIDLLLISENLLKSVQQCSHENAPVPDHKAVYMHIYQSNNKRGNGYWKLNVSILNDELYVKGITEIIRKSISDYQLIVSKGKLWELIKIKIKEYSISYCRRKSSVKTCQINEMASKLNALDKKLINCQSDDLITKRKAVKQNIDALYLEKAKGAQIRSRIKWVEESEKSTAYFLGLEKHHQRNNCIQSLKNKNIMYTDPEDILNVAKDFYSELYTSQNPSSDEIDKYLNDIETPILSNKNRSSCEGFVEKEECEMAIKKMKLNKSPGKDGLPVEFYLTFWPEIKNVLVGMYNESFVKKKLPHSLRKSVITLIFKKGIRTDIANYRPISLTNIDYKILAFTLASRIQSVIAEIVSPDQVAYVKKRFIGTNVRLISDVFNHYNYKNEDGVMMFLDFKKAFDSIEWDFIFSALDKFQFGEQFKQWIKLLYYRPIAAIKNNGYLSNDISLFRGVRQGCPVSALLFILCMEILSNSIKQNPNIKDYI